MTVLLGLDAGGSKLAVRVESIAGERLVDTELAAEGWEAEPAARAVEWLLARALPLLPVGEEVAAVGLGAQGCDNPVVAQEMRQAFAARGYRAAVVNDAAVLVPAAGLESGIGVIAGTGAIAVGETADGTPIASGGWGWVLGDDAGAVGIVREAVKTALAAHDDGRPDDGLLSALLATYGVATAERLARAVNDTPTIENWAPHAPAVFAAADAGSPLAAGVIAAAGAHLAMLVDQLARRGAVGRVVVASGGVITRQPELLSAFETRLAAARPEFAVRVLADRPVAGAVELARRLTPAEAPPHRASR